MQESHDSTAIQAQVQLIVEVLAALESRILQWESDHVPEAEVPPVIHDESLDAQHTFVAGDSAEEEATVRVSDASTPRQNEVSASATAAAAAADADTDTDTGTGTGITTTTDTTDTARTSGTLAEDRTEWLHVLRAQLTTYRIAKLIRRATDMGVATGDLDAAEDAESHKDALIELILETEQRALERRSEHRACASNR